MDPSVEDVGAGAAWRTGIVGEAELVVWRLLEGKLELGVVEEVTVEEVQVRVEGEKDC